jgi:SRSO17 transposase
LLHFVANAPWSDERVFGRIQELTLPIIEGSGAIETWIIDDTGFPKKGHHSVGVARQYCGQLGKQDNCQVAVSLSLANHAASLPVAWRLYLPLEWIADAARRAAAGIPETVRFLSKPEIALEQIQAACAAGLPRGVVLMDAGYGTNTWLREEIGALGLTYVAGIPPQTSVWPPGRAPLPPLPWSGRGRRPKLMRRDAEHQPVSVKTLALDLPAASWQTISWREGSAGALISRFARVRVRAAHRDAWRTEPRDEEWLLIEWPEGEAEPAKYWLATVPPDMSFECLVDLAKLRWRIERDYQDLKQELGLGHYEGRGWRGFHHHATLCIAAYAFLIAERARIPPSAAGDAADKFAAPEIPQNYAPRGAARASRTTCRKLDRDDPPTSDRRPRQHPDAMSMLQRIA